MNIETRSYRLTGTSYLLGGQPADPEIRTQFIASKAPTPERGELENDMLPDNIDEKGLTVFFRRDVDDALSLMDYMIVGFLKESMGALAAQLGIRMTSSKVGTYVFVEPSVIPILHNDTPIYTPDRILERPLRAMTMQGPRVALAGSELIEAPWQIEIRIKLVENAGTPKSKPVTFDAIEEALDYGALKGLGQWRNGGKGRFTWERIG